MSKPWPPPPDIDSIQELVANADIDGFIADGAPVDEYETEADDLFAAIKEFSTAELVPERLIPMIQSVWAKSFTLNEQGLNERAPRFAQLAQQISRFFGPEAKPQVRGA